jgi:phosphoribosylformimino-5-aminoimidazole carboxamide ribotide isomerase
MLLIPSIDLRGGRCVRLLRGDFAAETRYDTAPDTLLERYAALGAPWLHVVDLDGARDGRLANRDVLLALAARNLLRIQVGGGVRSAAVVDDLLEHGVARVVVGSAAVEASAEVQQWFTRHGAERICLAFDVRLDADGTPCVTTRGWTEQTRLSLWDAVERFAAHGLKHVLCTDVAQDGAMQGPNFALYAECRRRYPNIAWQASGGVRDADDLASLRALGVTAAISGKALLEGTMAESDLRRYLVV